MGSGCAAFPRCCLIKAHCEYFPESHLMPHTEFFSFAKMLPICCTGKDTLLSFSHGFEWRRLKWNSTAVRKFNDAYFHLGKWLKEREALCDIAWDVFIETPSFDSFGSYFNRRHSESPFHYTHARMQAEMPILSLTFNLIRFSFTALNSSN